MKKVEDLRASQSNSSEGGGSSDNLDSPSSQYQLWRSVSTSSSKTKKGARCYGLGNMAYSMDEQQSSSIPSCAPAPGVSQDEYNQVRSQVASLSAAYEEQQRVNERQHRLFQKQQRLVEKQQRQLQELYLKMGLDPLASSPAEENEDEDEDDDADGGADGAGSGEQ